MTDEDLYRSLATTSEGVYREKGSKFYAHAYPVSDEEAVKERLQALRRQYHDARHHCYAFVLKPSAGQEEYFRANDDGEPTHSAGDPILGQIRSHNLYDVLVVVVRYFGGTKLGVGGLVNAYKTAAAEALTHNRVVEKVRKEVLRIRFGYAATSEVQQIVHQCEAEVAEQAFEQDCYFRLLVPRSLLEPTRQRLTATQGVIVVDDE